MSYSQCLMVVAIVIVSGCASKVTPTGGPKDETPPGVVEEKSTTSLQTNFSERSFIITLDEWVKLEDAQTQVLVSPPLEKRPDIRLKGKAVLFKFHEEEILRENATYTINFGESIQDITEGNPLLNHTFVFSTGDIIDSLSIHGHLVDAYTGEPVEGATVMVYESMVDSVPLLEKPFYAAKSDEEGHFNISNVKVGTFQVVAIKDDNLNYLYDPANEMMGFLDSALTLPDTHSIDIAMSLPEPLIYLDKFDTSEYNQAKVTFSRSPHTMALTYLDDGDSSLWYNLRGSDLDIWYASEVRDSWPVEIRYEAEIDTLILHKNPPPNSYDTLQKLNQLVNTGHPANPFYVCFDMPVTSIDTALAVLVEGKTAQIHLSTKPRLHDSLAQCIVLEYGWKPDSIYTLTLLPGALTDVYGQKNDTIIEKVPIGNVERFGNIDLLIEGLQDEAFYLVELGSKGKVQQRFMIDSVTTVNRTIRKLKPGTYELRVTEDRNRNGRWDPGDLLQKRQPEPTRQVELEQLRANWDVEVNYKWIDQ